MRDSVLQKQKALLIGVAGSDHAFSLSLYNLKSYAYRKAHLQDAWDIDVLQYPLIATEHIEQKGQEIIEKILSYEANLIACSVYMWNIRFFEFLSSKLKSIKPDIQIVFGGPEMASDYLSQGKFNHLQVDYCVSGEGELTFAELLSHISSPKEPLEEIKGLSHRSNLDNAFVVNEKRDAFKSLMEIPSPFLNGYVDEEVLHRPEIEANLETQRGCSLRCSYCVYHKDMSKIAYNEVDRVIEEVQFTASRGVKKIRFVDANFSSNLDHAKAIMRRMIEHQFELKLMFELIPGFIDEELGELFGQFNALHEWNEITLGVGVQSINLESLRKIKRAIKIEKFEKTFELIKKHKLYAKIDLIIGLPSESKQDIENTLEYMMNALEGSYSHLLCCHVMRGLPGTELLKLAESYEMRFCSDHEPHELMESPALPRKDMLQTLRRTALIFRLVNHNGWTKREFIFDSRSESTNIHDLYFRAKKVQGLTNIQLIDRLITIFMKKMKPNSSFVQEHFPAAETWWWTKSRREITNKWIVEALESMIAS